MEFLFSILATILVSLVSFIGILLLLKRISSGSIIITGLISFAAGSLLGDAFLHLLPEQIEEFGYSNKIAFGIFLGIGIMLFFEAYLHCSHDSSKELEEHDHKHAKLAKMNIIGDGLHNFLDGIAIAVSFIVSPATGIATTSAVILHEIPQELADVSILLYSGWKRKKILLINFLTALSAVIGVLFVFIISSAIEHVEQFLIPMAAGQFIYIALADLVPEIHKKSGVKKYVVEIGMFILGIVIMYLLTIAE